MDRGDLIDWRRNFQSSPRFRLAALVLALLLVLSPLPGLAAGGDPLVLVGDNLSPPVEFLKDGKPAGLNVERIQTLAMAMGREVQIRLMPFAGRPVASALGKGDAALLAEINRGIAQLEAQDALADMRQAWSPQTVILVIHDKFHNILWIIGGLAVAAILMSILLWAFFLRRRMARPTVVPRGYRGDLEAMVRQRTNELSEAQRIGRIGHWRWYPDSDVVDRSEEMCRLIGCDRRGENPSGEMADAYIHPDDLARYRAVERLPFDTGEPYMIEYRYVPEQGSVRFFREAGHAERDSDGRIVSVFGVTQDITVQKQAEQSLQARELQLAEAQRIGKIGHWEYGQNDSYLDWSDELWRILGFDPDSDTLPDRRFETYTSMIHPADARRVLEVRRKAREDGQEYRMEHRIRQRNGAIRWVRSEGHPECDSDGNIVSIFGVTQDITEQKMAEAALREREGALSEAQRLGHIGHWRWFVETDSVERSEEMYRLMGLDPSGPSPSGKEGDRRVHPEDKKRYFDQHWEAVKTKKPFIHEYRYLNENGEVRYFKESALPEVDSAGTVVSVFGITLDLTEQKLVEEALRKRSELLSEAQRIGHMGHWRIPLDTEIAEWSDELWRIYGLEPGSAELTREFTTGLIHEDDCAAVVLQRRNVAEHPVA